MREFTGLYVATLTPFDSAGRIDFSVLASHTDFLVDGGVHGICPVGTTGEWLYLSVGEKARLIEASVAAASGRIKVIAGIGAIYPGEINLLARAAESVGADAVFLTPPIYYPASDDTVFRHYAEIRESCSLPLFAYNIPSHATNAVSMECIERLVSREVIAGIKDSTASQERLSELLSRFGSRINVLAASDSFVSQARNLGAHGFISAMANVWPRAFTRLWLGEDAVQPTVDSLRKVIKDTGGIPAIKHLLALRGISMGGSRIPNHDTPPEHQALLSAAIKQAFDAGFN